MSHQRLLNQHQRRKRWIVAHTIAIALLGALHTMKKTVTFVPGASQQWAGGRLVVRTSTLDGSVTNDYSRGARQSKVACGQASRNVVNQLYKFKTKMKPTQWRQLCAAHCQGEQNPNKFSADASKEMLSACQEIAAEDEKRRKEIHAKASVGGKPALNQAVMQCLKRNPAAEDIVYTVQEANGSFTATVELKTVVLPVDKRDGFSTLSFTGKAATIKKEAVDSAAGEAIKALFPKKVLEFTLSQINSSAAEPPRHRLSNAVLKLLTRQGQKDDVRYELRSKRAPFVADVFLTEDIRDAVGTIPLHFVGSESDNEKQAMDHAAESALAVILESATDTTS